MGLQNKKILPTSNSSFQFCYTVFALVLFQSVTSMGGGTFFKVGRHKCASKNYGNFLWFELANVTSQAFKIGRVSRPRLMRPPRFRHLWSRVQGRIQPARLGGGTISVIFGGQVSLRVHCCLLQER